MLQQSDQPVNFILDSIVDAGTNYEAGAAEAVESDGEDESDEENESDHQIWDDEEGDSYPSDYGSEDWYGVYHEDERCGLGIWDDEDEDDLVKISEDEGSDYESSTSATRLKKKAKTSQSVTASLPKYVQRGYNLSLLPTMPLDILFEIFSHLSPKDIVSLSRTSKVFRESLSSRNMLGVWKAARQRISAPDGPDWMSEEAWADLLFGLDCQSCGQSNVQRVDFLLLKRICVPCTKEHCILRSKVEKLYPDFDFVVLLLPSSTDILPLNAPSSSYYYWDVDLDSMIRKLSDLKDVADAQQLKHFMEERKRRLQCIRKNSSSWRKWYGKMRQDRVREKMEIENRRLEQLKDKFKELGYTDEDLRLSRSGEACRGPGKIQLTAKIWSRIRPILEPEAEERKAKRLQMELERIKRRRRQILDARYKIFQSTLHPSQWKYLPGTLEIAGFEAFSRYIEANAEIEVDETMFDDAFLELPKLLDVATEQCKATLFALMDNTPREDGEIGPDSIELATAVFQCMEVHQLPRPLKYLFGWDEIASHHCLPEQEGSHFSAHRTTRLQLKYMPEIADVVRKLAQLTGLDASTATAADFDEKNKRFSCDGCTISKFSDGRYFQVGYTWRTLAAHLEQSKNHDANSEITVLSGDAENEVKQCERNDLKWNANQWTCSHCPEYMNNLQNRQSIIKHLSDSHGIQVPSEPTDYFFFERYRKDWTAEPRFSVPAIKFRCLVCPSNKKRLFINKAIVDHLLGKHKIPSGQKSVHYVIA